MGLEQCTVIFQEQPYTRLIGPMVVSKKEILDLAHSVLGGDYFYGGVLDTGSGLSTYFGQGPDHDIFKTMIKKIAESNGQVCSGQVNINTETKLVMGILFLYDPGEKLDGISIEQTDHAGIKRRITKILTLVRALAPTMCEPKIDVGWRGTLESICKYEYLPQIDLLKKF